MLFLFSHWFAAGGAENVGPENAGTENAGPKNEGPSKNAASFVIRYSEHLWRAYTVIRFLYEFYYTKNTRQYILP